MASGDYTSVSGGMSNVATGYNSSIAGGVANQTLDDYDSVLGSRVPIWGFGDYWL